MSEDKYSVCITGPKADELGVNPFMRWRMPYLSDDEYLELEKMIKDAVAKEFDKHFGEVVDVLKPRPSK